MIIIFNMASTGNPEILSGLSKGFRGPLPNSDLPNSRHPHNRTLKGFLSGLPLKGLAARNRRFLWGLL